MTTASMQPEQPSDDAWPQVSDAFDGFQGLAMEGGMPAGGSMVGLTAIRQVEIPRAIQQLDDIVRGTECAANQILDACAALDVLGDELGGAVAARIDRATTAIYEACSFQDLAGQRITGVSKTLGLIEGKLSQLASQFGILADDRTEMVPLETDDSGSFDNVQLNGPQPLGSAADQAAIDHLFAEIE